MLKIRKLLSVLLSLAMVVGINSTVVFASETSEPEDEPSNYLIYDLKTGEKSSHSFDDLPDHESQSSPGYFPVPMSRALIGGPNSLSRIYNTATGPYCNTTYIEIDYGTRKSTFTGFMIGPSAVVTAGHCVIDAKNNGYNTITVIPAKNGAKNPYGSAKVTKLVVPDYRKNGPVKNDWAILELDTPIGNSTGWLGLKWQSASYINTKVWSTGYADYGTVPSQLPDDSYMYVGRGTVKDSFPDCVLGDWSAVSGFSGGPVYADYSDTGYTAIAILTGGGAEDGDEFSSSVYTYGTIITEKMFNLFMTYR